MCGASFLAAQVAPIGPAGPSPVRDPIVPGSGAGSQLSQEERLLRDLDTRIRSLDGNIRDVLVRYPNAQPIIDSRYLVGLDNLRDQRDAAWADVVDVMNRGPDGIVRDAPDVLDQPPGQKRDRDMDRFRAQVHLGIAECHRELYIDSVGVRDELDEGLASLDEVSATDLGPIEQPRYRFLRVWYAVEFARKADDSNGRSQHLATAQAALNDLRTVHADSITLINQAEQLIAGIDLDQAIERARAGAGAPGGS